MRDASARRVAGPPRRPRRSGVTLIEMGFVIGLLGLLSLLATYLYVDIPALETADDDRDDAVVQDVLSLIGAVRAYATANDGNWPVYSGQERPAVPRFSCLHVRELYFAGYLRQFTPLLNNDIFPTRASNRCGKSSVLGGTRFTECGTSRNSRCLPYFFINWSPTAGNNEELHRGACAGREQVLNTYACRWQTGNTGQLNQRPSSSRGYDLLLVFGVPGNTDEPEAYARAQAIADRLPNARVSEFFFANQMLIQVLLHEDGGLVRAGRQYVQLNGEMRPIVFRPGLGVLSGMRQLAIESRTNLGQGLPRAAARTPLDSAYPRTRMRPNELLLMADESRHQDEAAVSFRHRDPQGTNAATDTRIQFTVADRTSNLTGNTPFVRHHSLTFGAKETDPWDPVFRVRRYPPGGHTADDDLVFDYRRPQGSFPYWDIMLTQHAGHRSVQTRLCALERGTDDPDTTEQDFAVRPDLTCPSP